MTSLNDKVQGPSSSGPLQRPGEQGRWAGEEQFRILADATPVLMWMTGSENQCVYVNRAWLEFTGKSAEEQLGPGWLELIHDEDKSSLVDARRRGFRERAPFTVEFRLRRADGQYRWLLESGRPHFDQRGTLLGLMGSCIDISDSKDAEERYHASQDQLHLATEAAQIGTWEWDIRTGQLQWSSIHKRLWGFEPEHEPLVYQDWADRLLPDDLPRVERQLQQAIAGDQRYDVEYQILPVGMTSTRRIRSIGRAYYNEAAEALRFSGVSLDVGCKSQTHTTVLQSEEHYRTVVENQSEMICRFEPSGKILFVNAAYARARNTTPETLIGVNFWDFIEPEDRPAVQSILDRIRPDSPEVLIENRFVTASGTRWTLWTNLGLRFDADGCATEIQSSGMDISDRKRLEQSLRFLSEASKLSSSLVDSRSTLLRVAELAVPAFADWCLVDLLERGSLVRVATAHGDSWKVRNAKELYERIAPDHKKLHPAACKLLRDGQPELVRDIAEGCSQQRSQIVDQLMLPKDVPIRSYIRVPLTANNRSLGVMTFVSAESGDCYGLDELSIAVDVAQRVSIAMENARLYQELRDADRRKDEFLAMLAHELRNPLAPIRTGLEILSLDQSGHQETIGLMQRQLEHLVRLVDDLLDVSRIMRGRIELRKEPVELRGLVERSVEGVRPLIDRGGHQLLVQMPDEPIWLHADPVRLVQVIENLLSNAAKYTDAAGRIGLTVAIEDSQAVIQVRDNGMGIEPDLLPKVFELFSQSARTLDRAQGGLGIGLTLVQRLVRLHDGAIAAYSEGPGSGSTFVVRLPIVSMNAHTKERPAATGHIAARRILVVDDNMGAVRMLSMLLSKLGPHEIDTAYDGAGALAKIEAKRPEIVLLDLGLPGIDGYEVARTIRRRPELNGIILVALTGYGQEEDRRRSTEAGFNQHLVKPVEKSTLQRLLAALPS